MVWGCISAAGTGGLQFIEGTMNANMYCDILKQTMIPSLWRLGHRAVFQHENNYCLAKEAEGKGNLWSILKWKVEERKVSNIHQLCDVVMEEWKRIQWQTVKLWWTPCLRGLRQCWKIMVATQNIDTLGPIWTFSLRCVLPFVASGLDINGCVLSYFEGTLLYKLYTHYFTLLQSVISAVLSHENI